MAMVKVKVMEVKINVKENIENKVMINNNKDNMFLKVV